MRSISVFGFLTLTLLSPIWVLGQEESAAPSDSQSNEQASEVASVSAASVQFRFAKDAEGNFVLFPIVEVNIPENLETSAIGFQYGSRILKREAGKLSIAMEASREVVYDNQKGEPGPSNTLASIRLPQVNPEIQIYGCDTKRFKAELSQELPESFYLGIYCQLHEGDERFKLWITAPSDLEWGEMTLFETAGKGERWRAFDQEYFSSRTKEEVIGEFHFNHNGESYVLNLIQVPDRNLIEEVKKKDLELQESKLNQQLLQIQKRDLEKKTKKLEEEVKQVRQANFFQAHLQFGGMLASVKATPENVDPTNISSFQPFLGFDVATKPIFYSLGVGARLKYLLPPGKSDIFDISAGGQSSWSFGKFFFRPGISYHSFSNDVSSKGLAFRHTAVGIDLYFEYGSNWKIWSLISASGYLPSGDSKYFSFTAGYRQPFNSFLSWGAEAGLQQTTYDTIDGTFRQILVSGSVNY